MKFATIVAFAVTTSAVRLNSLNQLKSHAAIKAQDTEEPDNTGDNKPHKGYQAKDATTEKMWKDLEAADRETGW